MCVLIPLLFNQVISMGINALVAAVGKYDRSTPFTSNPTALRPVQKWISIHHNGASKSMTLTTLCGASARPVTVRLIKRAHSRFTSPLKVCSPDLACMAAKSRCLLRPIAGVCSWWSQYHTPQTLRNIWRACGRHSSLLRKFAAHRLVRIGDDAERAVSG